MNGFWFSGRPLATLMALAAAVGGVAAQDLRDPTRPPAEAGAPASAQGGDNPGKPAAIPIDSVAVLVRDGVPMLMHGTRLYRQGQQLGPYRIERITETEVWLRNGRELQKIAHFAGIQRRAAAPERSTP